jgi:hypothetical protein
MGLFYDWTGNWERKPAYWVYANFYQLMASETLALSGPSSVDVRALATRTVSESPHVAFWVTNLSNSPLTEQRFVIQNFPTSQATLSVHDNLIGLTPTFTTTLGGAPLVFTQTIPARSSRTFVVRAADAVSDLVSLSLAPASTSRVAGQSVAYALTAHYTYGDVDVTDAGVYAVSSGAGGQWDKNVYTTEISGSWTVSGTYAAETSWADLRVWKPSQSLFLPVILRE